MRTIKITTTTTITQNICEDERQEKKWRAKRRLRMKTIKKKGGRGAGRGEVGGEKKDKKRKKKKLRRKGNICHFKTWPSILSSPDTHPGRYEDDSSAPASRTFSELPPFIQGRDDLMHSR